MTIFSIKIFALLHNIDTIYHVVIPRKKADKFDGDAVDVDFYPFPIQSGIFQNTLKCKKRLHTQIFYDKVMDNILRG